jgi:hypothetical protein
MLPVSDVDLKFWTCVQNAKCSYRIICGSPSSKQGPVGCDRARSVGAYTYRSTWRLRIRERILIFFDLTAGCGPRVRLNNVDPDGRTLRAFDFSRRVNDAMRCVEIIMSTMLALSCILMLYAIPAERRKHTFISRVSIPHDSCVHVHLEKLYRDELTVRHCRTSLRTGRFTITRRRRANPSARRIRIKDVSFVPSHISSQILRECTGHALYRVRISGPEIFYADIEHQDQDTVVASYQLQSHGMFHAEIMQLYSNFSFCDLPKLNLEGLVAGYTWNTEPSIKPYCTDNRCDPCPSGNVLGRWVTDPSAPFIARLLRQLRSTHIFSHSPPVETEFNETRFSVLSSNLLKWQPLAPCSIEPTANAVEEWSRRCNATSGLVCFAGDSQMRHIYSMANSIISGTYLSPLTSGTTVKTFPISLWSRYLPVKFGDEAQGLDLQNCTSLALNIGQWPIAYTAGARPWTIQRYGRAVHELFNAIVTKNPHLRSRITWISTQPHGLVAGRHGSQTREPSDWRTDPFIAQQNAFMIEFTSRHVPPVSYIDTYGLLYPLSDLSYDSAHYHGTPGFWASALVLHRLCT